MEIQRLNKMRYFLKITLSLVTILFAFGASAVITARYKKYTVDIMHFEPISILLLLTSLSATLGLFYQVFSLSFIFKQQKLSKSKKQFYIPIVFKISILIFSIILYVFFIIAQINNPFSLEKLNWRVDLLMLSGLITIAT